MNPVQPVTNTEWFRYQRAFSPKGKKVIVEAESSFEENFAKALKERELIDMNDKNYDWGSR